MSPTAQPVERLRLFVALELPAHVREALLNWCEQAAGSLSSLRLIAGEHLHVTLCFLGGQARSEVPAIADACSKVGEVPAVRLALDAAVWLPPRRPRVLAIKLADPGGSGARLQATLAELLSRGGWYRPEKRPYLPHVTVARIPANARLRAVSLSAPPSLAFEAAQVTLYRSRLGRGGARYEALRQIGLTADA